jgi:hypothetical protein
VVIAVLVDGRRASRALRFFTTQLTSAEHETARARQPRALATIIHEGIFGSEVAVPPGSSLDSDLELLGPPFVVGKTETEVEEELATCALVELPLVDDVVPGIAELPLVDGGLPVVPGTV